MNNTSVLVGFPSDSKRNTLQYFCCLNLNPCNRFHENSRRSKRTAARRHAPLRQSYPLPSPNRCPLQNRRACHAAPTLCLPTWSSGPLRIEVQSAWQAQDLGPLRALSSARGARFCSKPHSRLGAARILPPYLALGPILVWQNCALACARCPLFLKMTLSPRRRAHFAIPGAEAADAEHANATTDVLIGDT